MSFSISTVLEVGLGLALIYYVLGLIVSYVTSKIAEYTNLRTTDLEAGLRELIDDPDKLQEFLDHPLIKNLEMKKATRLRGIQRSLDHIPPETFAQALFAVVRAEDSEKTLAGLRSDVERLPAGSDIRGALLGLIDSGATNLAEARKLIAGWFDGSMTKVSAFYKQRARQIAIIVALVVTLATGVDSVAIAKHLWRDPTSRAAVAAEVDRVIQAEGLKDKETQAYISELEKRVEIPILNPVWNLLVNPEARLDSAGWVSKLLGLAITWAAASAGAPFWYQVLKRIRSATTSSASGTSSET